MLRHRAPSLIFAFSLFELLHILQQLLVQLTRLLLIGFLPVNSATNDGRIAASELLFISATNGFRILIDQYPT
jgi:hypothetical protein